MRKPPVRLPFFLVAAVTLAFLSSACGGGGDSLSPVSTSPLPEDDSIVAAVSETDSDGEANFHDALAGADITVRAVDAETDAPVPGVRAHLASNGDHFVVLIEDPLERYAPGVAMKSYEDLQGASSETRLVLANPKHVERSLRAVAIEPVTVLIVLTAISALLTGVNVVELFLDPPTLLDFSLLESTFCATPDQLGNLLSTGLGLVLLLVGGGVFMTATGAVAPWLLEKGVIATVDEPVSINVHHLSFLSVGFLPLLQIGGPCEPAVGQPETPQPPTGVTPEPPGVTPGPADQDPATEQEPAGSEPLILQVSLDDNFFEPAQLEVRAGEPFRIELTNEGEFPHNLRITGPDGEYDTEPSGCALPRTDDIVSVPDADATRSWEYHEKQVNNDLCLSEGLIWASETGYVVGQIDEPGVYDFRDDAHILEQYGQIVAR